MHSSRPPRSSRLTPDPTPNTGKAQTLLVLLVVPLVFTIVAVVVLFLRPPTITLPPASTTVTVVRPSPSVLVAVRDLARLETAEFHLERVVDLRDKQSRFFGLLEAEDAVLLVAAGDVIAGIDLSSLKPEDITSDFERKTATLLLPKPTLLVTRLDSRRTYVHSRKTDVFAKRAESLEGRAREEAERNLSTAALEGGIIEKAKVNAERTVGSLVKSLGYSDVTIRFRD